MSHLRLRVCYCCSLFVNGGGGGGEGGVKPYHYVFFLFTVDGPIHAGLITCQGLSEVYGMSLQTEVLIIGIL